MQQLGGMLKPLIDPSRSSPTLEEMDDAIDAGWAQGEPSTSWPTLSHPRFIDTNILVRAITDDDPIQSPAAKELFVRIGNGEIDAMISMTVIFETVFVLESNYRLDRQAIAHSVNVIARSSRHSISQR